MSDTDFTPGPWFTGWGVGLSGDVVSWSCFLDGEEVDQLPIHNGLEAITIIYCARNHETNKANANLIAAAPDLYHALKELLSRVSNDKDAHAWFCSEQEAAIEALAKARGRL